MSKTFPFVCHKVGDRFSAVTSTQVLCYLVSHDAAVAAIQEAFGDSLSVAEIETVLDTQSPSEFRATLLAAINSELGWLSESKADRSEVADLRSTFAQDIELLGQQAAGVEFAGGLVQWLEQHSETINALIAEIGQPDLDKSRFVRGNILQRLAKLERQAKT